MKSKNILLITPLLIAALIAGCGGVSGAYSTGSAEMQRDTLAMAPMESAAAGYDYGGEVYTEEAYDYAMDEAEMADVAEEPSATGADTMLPIDTPSIETSDRKIVYTVDLSLQTTEFDEGVKQIPEMVETAGGFVQDSYVQGTNINERYYSRSASFTVRVPVEKLTAFTEDLGGIFHVVSQQKSSSDISNSYYDTQARLDSLRIQEERLKAMLETADELQYLLEVERELAQVLYEIESMTSSLRRMDSSVNLSTITIHLQEVSIVEDNLPEPKPITFGDRVREAFGDSLDGFIAFCQGLVIFIISLIPYLPIFLVIAVLIWLFVRAMRKRRAKRPPRQYPVYVPQTPPGTPPTQGAPPQQPNASPAPQPSKAPESEPTDKQL